MFAVNHYPAILKKLPQVPSATPVYQTTVTTTTNEDTSTFTTVAIGTPHPKRLVVLAVYHGVAAVATGTVNGIPLAWSRQNAGHEFSLLSFQVPNDTTATITITATTSLRKAVSVYATYPQDHTIIEVNQATANATSNATVSDLKVAARGFMIYAGGQHATVGAFTTTWTGPSGAATDAVVEDVDAQLESVASYTMGHVNNTVSSDTDDITLAETVSGQKRINVASWGPCAPYAGLDF